MRLVSNWRDWWRMASVQLQIVAASLLTLIEVFPNAVYSAWAMAPTEVRSLIDPSVIRYVGIACIVAGAIARLVRQPKLVERKAGIDASGVPDSPVASR